MVIRVIIVVNLLDIYYKIESMVSPANEQFGEALFTLYFIAGKVS